MSLVLKPDPAGEKHYLVYDGDVSVGRIFQKYAMSGLPSPWFWGLDWFVWRRRGCTLPQYGEADDRDDAMALFRAAWDSGNAP